MSRPHTALPPSGTQTWPTRKGASPSSPTLASTETSMVEARSVAVNSVLPHSTLAPSGESRAATQWCAVSTKFWVSNVPEQAG